MGSASAPEAHIRNSWKLRRGRFLPWSRHSSRLCRVTPLALSNSIKSSPLPERAVRAIAPTLTDSAATANAAVSGSVEQQRKVHPLENSRATTRRMRRAYSQR
jgi:hypothetical protein